MCLLICLTVFSKLAKQLTADTLVDLAIIPLIFLIQTVVSYVAALVVSKGFAFKKRQKNFVVAMGVRVSSASCNTTAFTEAGVRSSEIPIRCLYHSSYLSRKRWAA